jgi:hypothetical protein
MKIKIEYTDANAQEIEGDYEVHDTYIRCKIPTFRGENYPWYELIIPMNGIMYFEAHP